MTHDTPHTDESGDGSTCGTRTTRRQFLRQSTVGGLAVGLAATGAASAAADAPEHFVETDGQRFVVDGQEVFFAGTNNYWLTDGYAGTQERVDEAFRAFDRLGFDLVRTWAYCEGQGGNCFQPELGVYDEAAFQQLDYLVAKAREYGLRLVLALTDNWDHYGGIPKYVEWVDGADHHNDFYTNEECRQYYRDYVEHVLTRENTITGVEYREEPAIAIWELANEPRAPASGYDGDNRQVLHEWIADTSAFVKDLDSNHLVSTGMEGFYADGRESSWLYSGSEGTDFVEDHSIDTIDCCTYHMYPDLWDGLSVSSANDWIQEHARDAHEEVGKPVYAGEFNVDSGREQAFDQWTSTFDETDTDGELVWQVDVGTSDEQSGELYEDMPEIQQLREYAATTREKSAHVVSGAVEEPQSPRNLTQGSWSADAATVGWDVPQFWGPEGADHYQLYVDGEPGPTVDPWETEYRFEELAADDSFAVSLSAVTDGGAESDRSSTVTVRTAPEEFETFVDPCEDTSALDDGSDVGTLGVDETNSEYFLTPDGQQDDVRLVRQESESTALVYRPDGQLLEAAVQFHSHEGVDGDGATYYVSSDGESWEQVPLQATEHSTDGSWSSQVHRAVSLPAGTRAFRIVLESQSEDASAWTPQIGRVELTYDSEGTPSEECTTLADGADVCDVTDDDYSRDVDADGSVGQADVAEFFSKQHRSAWKRPELFDFTGNGAVTHGDVVELFDYVALQ